MGIENDTQHSKENAPRHHRYRKQYPAEVENKRALTGIENDTRQTQGN